jgi:hypothetical protein
VAVYSYNHITVELTAVAVNLLAMIDIYLQREVRDGDDVDGDGDDGWCETMMCRVRYTTLVTTADISANALCEVGMAGASLVGAFHRQDGEGGWWWGVDVWLRVKELKHQRFVTKSKRR